jgi:iron(III) transport system substrate-binding protein
VKPFEQKYGVKVNVWRAGTDKVLQRAVTEAKAKRYTVDAVHFRRPGDGGAVAREDPRAGVLARAQGPPAGIVAPRTGSGPRPSSRVGAGVQHGRGEQGRPAQDLQGFARPEVEGQARHRVEERRLVRHRRLPDGGEQQGLKYFQDLVAANGISPRHGHTLLNNMVVSGEVPLALTVYNYMPEQAKKKGAPIDWFVIEPAIARANAVGVARNAPHPAAALSSTSTCSGPTGRTPW